MLATLTYDAADRLMQITDVAGSNQLLNLSYARDGSNKLTGENSTSYGYDSNNRVTAATTGGTSSGYGYDAADDLTKINAVNSTTQVYDAANQLQTATTMNGSTQVQKYTYTYDANGNRTSRTDKNNVVTNFGWDQANRVTSAGTTAAYSYNGDGLRMSKAVSGTPEAFTWNVAGGLPTIIQDGSTSYVTDASGLPVEQITGTTVHFYHQDQLGSTRALSGSAGTIATTYTYDVYGNVSVTGNVSNPFQFAGQYLDGESVLSYLRTRYYDPSTGQFISRDPAVAMTRQPYSYGYDDPLKVTDPSGLFGWDDLKHAAGWAAGAVASGVGAAHDYLIDTQSKLDAGLGGDLGQGAQGVGQSFVVASAFTGVAGVARAGIAGCAGLLARQAATDGAGNAIGITFGHGARHLAGTGLGQAEVEGAISTAVRGTVAGADSTGYWWGRVAVQGQTIEYRAWTTAQNVIHVGTYYVP